jgi:hypothetical protein
MKQYENNPLSGVLGEVLKGLQMAQSKNTGVNPFEEIFKAFTGVAKASENGGSPLGNTFSVEDLPLELIDEQVTFWTELKKKKEQEKEDPLLKAKALKVEIDNMHEKIQSLTFELPFLLQGDPVKAQESFTLMNDLSRTLAAKMKEFESLKSTLNK